MDKNKEKKKKAEKSKFRTLKQNQKILETASKNKQNRHVQVKDEPVLKKHLHLFQNKYAKEVAAKSALEILKEVNKDDF